MDLDFNNLEKFEQEFFELLARFSEDDHQVLKDAYMYASKKHDGQYRDEGSKYIIHPLRATITLIRDVGITDIDMLVAMMLHDVVEDTNGTLKEVKELYGERVAGFVSDLTREQPEGETEEDKRINKPIKYTWLIEVASKESKILKAADILDNLRSWWMIPAGHPSHEKFHRWFREAKVYSLPLVEQTNPTLLKLFEQEFINFKQDPYFSQFIV